MIVICKMQLCPYYDKRGYCAKSTFICIDQMGMCNVIWKNGQQKLCNRGPFVEGMYSKTFATIEDAEVKTFKDIEEQEDAGSLPEDPINGDPA